MEPFVTLTPLVERSSHDLEGVAQKIADRLTESSETCDLQGCIYDDGKPTYYVLKLAKNKTQLQTLKIANPHFEIITTKEIALEIAKGRLSPMTAFYEGQMRIRGDVELGKRLLAHFVGERKPPSEIKAL